MDRKNKKETGRDGFQSHVIDRLGETFRGCYVLKNDPQYIACIPDLLVLVGDRWAMLECKRSVDAYRNPNQQYYIDDLNKIGFGRFIYPENEEEVFEDLVRYFRY